VQDPVHSRFLVRSEIEPLIGSGGVRLEDNVLVTGDGALSLTDVPRTVEDVEAVLAGAPWPRDGSRQGHGNSIAGVPVVPGIKVA
jgi:Xaa-Pro dipeptidase